MSPFERFSVISFAIGLLVSGIIAWRKMEDRGDSLKESVENIWHKVNKELEWRQAFEREIAEAKLQNEKELGRIREKQANSDSKLDSILHYLEDLKGMFIRLQEKIK